MLQFLTWLQKEIRASGGLGADLISKFGTTSIQTNQLSTLLNNKNNLR